MGRPRLPGRALLAAVALAASLALVSAAAGAAGPVVTVTHALPGLNDAVAGGFEPPDVQVAAGRGFLVELVNVAMRVWRTAGGDDPQEVLTRRLGPFFGSGRDRLTDPRVLFDGVSGRWLASISDLDRHAVLLAASRTADPTGAWTVTSLDAGGCADQPRLGTADAVVVVAADVYDGCEEDESEPLGAQLWVVDKAQLLAGQAKPEVTIVGPTAAYASLAPAQALSPSGTAYVAAVDRFASLVVHVLAVDGAPAAGVQVRELGAPAIAALARPPQAAQSTVNGPQPPIETNDNRLLDSVWEGGRLWLAANTRCMPTGDIFIRTCARVMEVATAGPTLTWQADLGSVDAHVFYPALRPDGAGDLVVVAGESGASLAPRLVAFGRTPDGTFTKPAVVARSAGPYHGNRYGDYFAAARDPADPRVVWVAGEAGTDVASGHGWTTSVASVVVTPAGGTPPAVAGTPPPGVRAVGTVVRVSNGIRLSYRPLDDGVGVRAVVRVRDARRATVYRVTTPSSTLRAERRYGVVWPARNAHGRFTYCVSTISRSGIASPPSCVRIMLR